MNLFWVNRFDVEDGKPTVHVWVYNADTEELSIQEVPREEVESTESRLVEEGFMKVARETDLPLP